MKILACLIALAAFQGKVLYEDPTHMVRVYGFTKGQGETLDNGDIQFSMIGNPATVESRLDGMTATGSSMSGIVSPITPDPNADKKTNKRRSFVKEFDAKGKAQVTLDTDMLYKAQVENAAKSKTPPPKEPTSKDLTTFTSELLAYRGTREEGTLTVPNAFTVDAVSDGKSKAITFHQVLKATGTKGVFTLSPDTEIKMPLRTGTISGPVNMRVDRTESQEGKPDQNSWLTAVADKIEIDFTEKRTITLTGNIRMEGEGGSFAGTTTATVCVLTLDENYKVVKVRVEAFEDRLRERKTGGGKR